MSGPRTAALHTYGTIHKTLDLKSKFLFVSFLGGMPAELDNIATKNPRMNLNIPGQFPTCQGCSINNPMKIEALIHTYHGVI